MCPQGNDPPVLTKAPKVMTSIPVDVVDAANSRKLEYSARSDLNLPITYSDMT